MLCSPFLIYWCWICVHFNQGRLLLPTTYDVQGVTAWWKEDIWGRIVTHAAPTPRAVGIYLGWMFFQACLFAFGPGPLGEGLPVPDGFNQGKRLKYRYNG